MQLISIKRNNTGPAINPAFLIFSQIISKNGFRWAGSLKKIKEVIMDRGYISLWRRLQDNELWLSEPFTKGQAWVDLLMLANHKPGMFFLRGNEIQVKKGFIARSELSLSGRWRWSKNKVRNFLKLLETKHQIEQHRNPIINQIEVLNYSEYQEKVQQKADRKTTEGRQKDTNNNYKHDNNDNKVNNTPLFSDAEITKVKRSNKKLKKESMVFMEKSFLKKANISITRQNQLELLIDTYGLLKLKYIIDRTVIYWKRETPSREFRLKKRWNKFYENIEFFLSENSLSERIENEIKWEKRKKQNTGYDIADIPEPTEKEDLKIRIESAKKSIENLEKFGLPVMGSDLDKLKHKKFNEILKQLESKLKEMGDG